MRPEYTQDMQWIQDFLSVAGQVSREPLIAKAEEAMQGLLILPGTGNKPVFVGNPPRWNENTTGVGGFTWMLSRLGYMNTLCKAFLVTKDSRYLSKVETDLKDWMAQNPAPPVPTDYESACYYHAVHNWRMLELGYRMVYTYPVIRSVLRVYGNDRTLPDRIDQSIAEHAERIAAGSHLLWPQFDHNHYTEEISGLLAAASMIPDHPRAKEWLQCAMDGLEKASANQITEDGSQSEGAALYHTAVTVNFCLNVHFAKTFGDSFSDDFLRRLRRAITFSVHTLSPDGNVIPFGDADVHFPTPILAALMGTLLFEDDIWLNTVRSFVSADRIIQVLHDLYPWGLEGVEKLIKKLKSPLQKNAAVLPTTTYQHPMDQYITRTAWEDQAAYLFFSCHSPIHQGSNHAHMDQLGVIYGAFGKPLIQDPGRYTYKNCEERHWYKSSQAHSLPTVGARDGFAYINTFAYGPQKEGSITGVINTPRMHGASGRLCNYAPVVISRTAVLVDGSFLLIADTFEHARGEDLQVFFHLNSTKAALAGPSVYTQDDDVNLMIAVSAPIDVETKLLPGNLSDVFYQEYPSTRAVFRCTGQQDTETLFFIAAASKGRPGIDNFQAFDGQVCARINGKDYRFQWENGTFRIL